MTTDCRLPTSLMRSGIAEGVPPANLAILGISDQGYLPPMTELCEFNQFLTNAWLRNLQYTIIGSHGRLKIRPSAASPEVSAPRSERCRGRCRSSGSPTAEPFS